MIVLRAVVALLVVLTISSCEISSGKRTTSGRVKTVVFNYSERSVAVNEYEVPADTEVSEPSNRVVTKITSLPAEIITTPTLSPDGTKLAFSAKNGNGWNVRVVALGQNGVQEVTRGEWIDGWPRFLADPSSLIFCSNRLGEGFGICRIATAGVGGIGSVVGGSNLSSPDVGPGDRLVFDSTRQGFATQIWTTAGNGGFLTQLGEGSQPRWAPNGSSIVFVRPDRTTRLRHVWVMQADGSNERKLTDGDGDDVDPCWSPDGKTIAFASTRGKQQAMGYDIYTIDPDGNGLTQITSNLSFDRYPMFGPDPTQMYFLSSRGGQLDVWRVSLK